MFRIRLASALAATMLGTALGSAALTPAVATAAPKPAKAPAFAYLRGGDVYLATGSQQRRLTVDGRSSRPRWSPDGTRIAYLSAGALWVMNADGSGKVRAAAVATGGPTWSPDGRWIAFVGPDCFDTPAVLKVTGQEPFGAPAPLLPTSMCTTASTSATPAPPATGGLTARLRADDAVAWSPDGTMIAMTGGECEAIADDCLSIADVATGRERTVAAYGGGGQADGFAVLPAWRPDGAQLAWTAYQEGAAPVHVTASTLTGAERRTVGAPDDRELAYVDSRYALVTGARRGGSWVTLVDLVTGERTYLRPGSQPAPRPA